MWHRIDRELDLRRARHLMPGSWADIARALDTTEQRVNNWKRRGVPPAQYSALATALSWSVDYLLGIEDERATVHAALPMDQVQVLADLAELLPEEREQWLRALHEKADYARKIRSFQPDHAGRAPQAMPRLAPSTGGESPAPRPVVERRLTIGSGLRGTTKGKKEATR